MKRDRRRLVFASAMMLLAVTMRLPAEADVFTVAGVQLSIDTALYASEDAFTAGMEARIRRIVREHTPDLIVFPEYTSVFLATIPFAEHLEGASTMTEALTRITTGGIGCPLVEQDIMSALPSRLRDFFVSASGRTELIMDRIWGGLARKFGVYIVGGTYFAAGGDDFLHPELRNRLVVYGPDGGIAYTQDMVLLSSYETEMLMLSPGSIDDADGIEIDGERVVFTICRSTFLEQWEDVHAGADVWIDLKAEGVPFDDEVRARFVKALPSRIAWSEVPFGFTVCLTGSFLDLSWEGRSSIVTGGNCEFEYLIRAEKHDSEEVLVFDLP